jgi:hypothetical protein
MQRTGFADGLCLFANRLERGRFESAPKLLTQGRVYPLMVVTTCVLGGSLFFYLTTPDPQSSPFVNFVIGAFFTLIFDHQSNNAPTLAS